LTVDDGEGERKQYNSRPYYFFHVVWEIRKIKDEMRSILFSGEFFREWRFVVV
jgi:hypothetical protein